MKAQWCRPGAYVMCRDDQGRLLLARTSAPGHEDDGCWTLPGGGIEWGETVEETALRELGEEAGVSARLGTIAGVFTSWFTAHEAMRGEAGYQVFVIFNADLPVGEPRPEGPGGSTDDARWFTLDEARALPALDLLERALKLL